MVFGASPGKTKPFGHAGKIMNPRSLQISCFMAFFCCHSVSLLGIQRRNCSAGRGPLWWENPAQPRGKNGLNWDATGKTRLGMETASLSWSCTMGTGCRALVPQSSPGWPWEMASSFCASVYLDTTMFLPCWEACDYVGSGLQSQMQPN